ncbi:uncharacterized protein LOC118150486 [Callithrix jacchus]|uniref:uncharacterized protein LOC118150486 n=1 Tax=Callithrix jacchus TaxID=9483 RepID=UPI00159EF3D3|nr:uncharacterized protein LOC118150486 [Callithrix jacchus]
MPSRLSPELGKEAESFRASAAENRRTIVAGVAWRCEREGRTKVAAERAEPEPAPCLDCWLYHCNGDRQASAQGPWAGAPLPLLLLTLLLLLLKGSPWGLAWGLVGVQKVSSATDAPIRDWAFFLSSFLHLLPHQPAMTCTQAKPLGERDKGGDRRWERVGWRELSYLKWLFMILILIYTKILRPCPLRNCSLPLVQCVCKDCSM